MLVLDRDRIADYQKMAQDLRAAGIRAELYLGESGMKAQMKYADRRGSPCVVIQGGDEKAKGEVQIKDLILGATLTSIEDREEYLKKQAEAQFAVPEAQLVETVRQVLARHKVLAMAAESAKEFEALEAQATTLLDLFRRAGYEQVAPSIIQPADIFLDQIGEQIRSRTYVFTDLAGDELCLRPDLTVPVSRLYLERHPKADHAGPLLL